MFGYRSFIRRRVRSFYPQQRPEGSGVRQALYVPPSAPPVMPVASFAQVGKTRLYSGPSQGVQVDAFSVPIIVGAFPPEPAVTIGSAEYDPSDVGTLEISWSMGLGSDGDTAPRQGSAGYYVSVEVSTWTSQGYEGRRFFADANSGMVTVAGSKAIVRLFRPSNPEPFSATELLDAQALVVPTNGHKAANATFSTSQVTRNPGSGVDFDVPLYARRYYLKSTGIAVIDVTEKNNAGTVVGEYNATAIAQLNRIRIRGLQIGGLASVIGVDVGGLVASTVGLVFEIRP